MSRLADNRGSGDVRQQSSVGTHGCSALESRRVTGGESSSNGTLLFKGLDGQPRPNGDGGTDRTAYFPLAPWSAVWRGGWQRFFLLLLGLMSRFAVLSPFPPRGERGRGGRHGRRRPPRLQALGAGAPWGPGGVVVVATASPCPPGCRRLFGDAGRNPTGPLRAEAGMRCRRPGGRARRRQGHQKRHRQASRLARHQNPPRPTRYLSFCTRLASL